MMVMVMMGGGWIGEWLRRDWRRRMEDDVKSRLTGSLFQFLS